MSVEERRRDIFRCFLPGHDQFEWLEVLGPSIDDQDSSGDTLQGSEQWLVAGASCIALDLPSTSLHLLIDSKLAWDQNLVTTT